MCFISHMQTLICRINVVLGLIMRTTFTSIIFIPEWHTYDHWSCSIDENRSCSWREESSKDMLSWRRHILLLLHYVLVIVSICTSIRKALQQIGRICFLGKDYTVPCSLWSFKCNLSFMGGLCWSNLKATLFWNMIVDKWVRFMWLGFAYSIGMLESLFFLYVQITSLAPLKFL